MENWILIALFFVILYFIIKLEVDNSTFSMSIPEATVWINRENAFVVDIRDKKEFDEGHIAGAKHITLGFPEKNSPWDKFKKKKVLLVCADGRVSKRVLDKVSKSLGHKDVKYLQGGIVAWREENLPLKA